jgi:hypothetical protein
MRETAITSTTSLPSHTTPQKEKENMYFKRMREKGETDEEEEAMRGKQEEGGLKSGEEENPKTTLALLLHNVGYSLTPC